MSEPFSMSIGPEGPMLEPIPNWSSDQPAPIEPIPNFDPRSMFPRMQLLSDGAGGPGAGMPQMPMPAAPSYPEPTSPGDLGVPMFAPIAPPTLLPVPGKPAPFGPTTQQRIGSAMAAIAAMIAGGPRGAGIAQGWNQGQREVDAERFRQYQINQQGQLRADAINAENQRAQAVYERQRAQQLQSALMGLSKDVDGALTKDQYDQAIDRYGRSLTYAGYRGYDPNALRVKFPFVAPTASKLADATFAKYEKNPYFKQAFEQNPANALNSTAPFDIHGDGTLVDTPIWKIAELAGRPFLKTPDGQFINAPKGTDKGEFATAYNNGLDKFRADKGREPTPDEKDAIISSAADLAKGSSTAAGNRQQKAARDAAYSAILQGVDSADMRNRVVPMLRRAGLEPETEFATAREKIMTEGRRFVSPQELAITPLEKVFQIGRQSLLGQFPQQQPSVPPPAGGGRGQTPSPAPPPAGRGGPPPQAINPSGAGQPRTMTRTEVRAVAAKLGIDEQQAEAQAKARGFSIVEP